MHVQRTNGHITISDRAGAHWFLGLFLLAGGVLATAAAVGWIADAATLRSWERGLVLAIGLGGSAGALWWLRRSPCTRVILDLHHRRMRVRRFGLSGRQVEEFGFEQMAGIAIERGQDDEGGNVSRPIVYLKSGSTVLLSALWSHDDHGVIAAAGAVAAACELPPPVE